MRILVSGSTGLVGSAVVQDLSQRGHELIRLLRPGSAPVDPNTAGADSQRALWNPASGLLDSRSEGGDAVIHLAGASIAGHRWTGAWKRQLRDSRVSATRHLVQSFRQSRTPPKLFIAASAIGFYASRGDEELTESSPPGSDFLAQLTRDWESESACAAEFGARVVILRFGIILAHRGGALPRMALPFRLGLGGRIGSGLQWMSWVALEDVIGIIRFSLETNLLSGPTNVVAPTPIRNRDFTATLARVLHRPSIFPVPAVAVKLALGEMAEPLLLASQRVYPAKLQNLGYRFLYPDLEPAMASVLSSAG